ncbi:MAG: hypothetical protein SF002_16640 [Alphaproteobacteria bacterium]|nr:hypothetical protein [Alphaproteobacteria bacterium]
MARCLLAFPNLIDGDQGAVTLSGGRWRAALPLSNLGLPQLAAVARSETAAPEDTWFQVDLGVTRDVRVLAIPRHTLSPSAKVRVRAGPAPLVGVAPIADIDTGWSEVWGQIYPAGTLPWGHPSVWDGRLRMEDTAGYPMPVLVVWEPACLARYWRVDIEDASNPAGVIDLSRLVLSPGWQPSLNLSYGARLGWDIATTAEISLGGARWFDVRPPRRVASFTLEGLPEDEMLSVAFDLQQRLGLHRQLFFVFDPDDRFHRHRRSFLATLGQVSRLEFPYFRRVSAGFDIEEVIA